MQGRGHIEGEEVCVDHDIVEEVFLYHLDDFVVIGLGQTFQGRLFDNVAKVEMVLPVLWFSELVDEKSYRVGMWPHKAETPEMAHLFTFGVVQAVDEVDLVVEEGGLSDGRRDAGHRFAVQQEDLHLRRWRSVGAVARRNHLGHIAGGGLHDIHPGVFLGSKFN